MALPGLALRFRLAREGRDGATHDTSTRARWSGRQAVAPGQDPAPIARMTRATYERGDNMAKGDKVPSKAKVTGPYHTDSLEYPPGDREVYHDYSNCPDGEPIKKKHRHAGPGEPPRPRCKRCVEMDSLPH